MPQISNTKGSSERGGNRERNRVEGRSGESGCRRGTVRTQERMRE